MQPTWRVIGAGAAALLGCAARLLAGAPAVEWYVYDPDVQLGSWKARLAMVSDTDGWLGGCRRDQPAADLLYRLQHGLWRPVADFPTLTSRAFVLDVDPAGTLWLASFLPDETSTYDGLRLDRFDARGWRHEVVRPGIWPQAMAMLTADEGWISGNRGLLLHRRQGRWRRRHLDLPPEERAGLTLFDLAFSDPEHGWAVGSRGLVARYAEDRWRPLATPPELARYQLNSLDLTADGSVWIAGSGGVVARFDGVGWQVEQPVAVDLYGIDMVSAEDGWIVGEAGTVLRFDGERWQRQAVPTSIRLYDVAMLSPTDGWIAGEGVVLRSHGPRPLALREAAPSAAYPMLVHPSYRAAAADFDGDGRLDLLTLSADGVRVYRGAGAAGFHDAPEVLPLAPPNQRSDALALAVGDVDGDGDLDLVSAGDQPEQQHVLANRGDGTFADVSVRSGVAATSGTSNTPYLIDLDRDGHLDLYLARGYDVGPDSLANLLYLGDGTGRFTLADDATGDRGMERIVLWGDLDGDRDQDAVLPGYNSASTLLYRNDAGAGARVRLVDVTAGSGLDRGLENGLYLQGHLCDLDVDGDLDLLLLGERLSFFRNDGAARFTLEPALFGALHSTIGVASALSAVGDLDHDGHADVIVQPVVGGRRTVRLYLHQSDGTFSDVTAANGLDGVAGDGAVLADFDDDGDLDLFVATTPRGRLFLNELDDGRFLKVRPRGVLATRQAIGAEVAVFDAGRLGDPAALRGLQQVGVGGNASGLASLDELHFGLADDRRYDVRVTFPSGREVVAEGVAAGRTVTVFELPFGVRHAVAAWRAGRRVALLAELPAELARLAAAALLLALGRPWLARRIRGELLLLRRSVATTLAAGYLAAATVAVQATVGEGGRLVQSAPLAGLAAALLALAALDRALSRRRRARHLGPYRLLAPLGEGGMGVVYEARHVVSRERVALKVIHPRLLGNPASRQRFLRERRLMQGLDHPNLVRLLAAGEVDGRAFLAAELLAGVTLRARLDGGEPLRPAELCAIAAAVCDALACLHARGIVHRDVKAENVFLCAPAAAGEGWEQRVKLMDLGLARGSDAATVTELAGIVGTLTHLAPEQLRGAAVDGRADLYALGVVLYHALAGQLPFAGDGTGLAERVLSGRPAPLRALAPQLSPAVEEVVMTLLARSPDDRFPSAEAARAALLRLARTAGAGPAAARREASVAPAGPSQPAPASAADPPAAWQTLYAQARQEWEAGRPTAAEVIMLDCLAALAETLRSLAGPERAAFGARADVAAALAFMRRLQGLQDLQGLDGASPGDPEEETHGTEPTSRLP